MKVFAKLLAPVAIKRKFLVASLLITVLIIGWFAMSSNKHGTLTIREPIITYSTDTPDESKESADTYAWKGAPDEPRRIIIDTIRVDAFVQKVGVDQHQKVAVPNNVHLAGWFVQSVKPGQNGLSIIAGHVSGRASDGIFKELEQLQKGDAFEIELGSGEIKRYKVINTAKLAEADSASHLFSQNPRVSSQVNLVTCGGEFDESSQQYADRVIISGELVE